MTLFDLTGKVAIVTGSTRGIGRAIAERMAEHGAKVVISSRKQQVCDEVATAINDKPGQQTALAVAANISSKDDLQHLVDETNRAFGKIDILVCNAASNPYYGPMAGISDEEFRKILDNNIVSNHWLISLVVPEMIERKDGSIIIVSSIGGLRGSTVHRRLRYFQGRRHAAGAQPGRANTAGTTSASTASRRAWSRPISPRRCGTIRRPESAPPRHAAAPHRRTRRDRRRGGVPGSAAGVHDRADHRGRRRRDNQLKGRAGAECHGGRPAVNRFALAIGALPMLETGQISGDAWFPQGCSSVGRVPVSKTGCRRFEPCRPCQPDLNPGQLNGAFFAKYRTCGRLCRDGHQRSGGERLLDRRARPSPVDLPPSDAPNQASLIFALYAAARTILLALFALVAISRQAVGPLLILGGLAGFVQLLDAGIGAVQGDIGKTIGPLVIAVLQFACLYYLRRTTPS